MPRVLNKRDLPRGEIPEGAVYVGRPGPFGNPFVIVPGRVARDEVVALFERWIKEERQGPLLARARRELAGKDLVCWCAPKACHADVLLKLVNG